MLDLTVAICTFRRPAFLRELLATLVGDVARERAGDPRPRCELLVIDNDPDQSGRAATDAIAHPAPSRCAPALRYIHEPTPGVSFARNRAVAEARADTLLFLDDDQLVRPGFLAALWEAWLARPNGVDGLRLDVRYRFEPGVPARARALFPSMHTRDHDRVGRALFGTGGLIVSRALLAQESPPFLPALAQLGGEDTELFIRLSRRGAVFAHLASVHVEERVTPDRASLTWLLRRQFKAGFLDASIDRLHAIERGRPRRKGSLFALGVYLLRRRLHLLPMEPWHFTAQRLAHALGRLYESANQRLPNRRPGASP